MVLIIKADSFKLQPNIDQTNYQGQADGDTPIELTRIVNEKLVQI